jgi:hypothetical protein
MKGVGPGSQQAGRRGLEETERDESILLVITSPLTLWHEPTTRYHRNQVIFGCVSACWVSDLLASSHRLEEADGGGEHHRAR